MTTAGQAPDKVTFLMYSVDGGGGVARTVVNLANELVRSREVEIVSVVDRVAGPRFATDPRVELTYLQTLRKRPPKAMAPDDRRWRDRPARTRWSRWLARRPTELNYFRDSADPAMTRWGDRLIRRHLRSMGDGILITTRPSLHLAASRWAPPGVTTIGQDHLNFLTRSAHDAMMAAQREALMGLDALVVLTAGDRADYERWLPDATARIEVIPNGCSWSVAHDVPPLTAPVAVAGGRLEKQKAFGRMIRAWAPLAAEFPEWQLHIYGRGAEQPRLEKVIGDLGLEGSVFLKGYSTSFGDVMRSSSLYLMSSRFEGFPMVLVEAMGQGLPLVAFDCPRGPADVIRDGVNGRLVPDGDRAGYTEALRELMSDPAARQRMGSSGLDMARGYQMPEIAARWVELFETLGRR